MKSQKTLNIKSHNMDTDGETYIKYNKGEKKKNSLFKRFVTYVGVVFQPVWVRCSPIFADIMDRRFMESEFYYVLYCGSFFWVLFIFHEILK